MLIATNKKAYRDFFFTEKWECGIVLQGPEVKSIRAGYVNFKDSFARVEKEEIWLYNLHIEPYAQASYLNAPADRPRKLLLNKKEINKIIGTVSQKHLALVPTKIYFNARGIAKIELAAGKGKKLYDKREDIKTRDIKKDLDRIMKLRRK